MNTQFSSKNILRYNKILNDFGNNGFTKIKIFNKNNINDFKKKILLKLYQLAKKKNVLFKNGINIENYHKTKLKIKDHKILMNSNNRFLKLSSKEQSLFVNKDMDCIFEHYYGNTIPEIKFPKRKKFVKNLIGFRVVTPKEKTIAKFHSESSYGIHCFTLWVPLTGTDKRYTLKVIPKSHRFRHKDSYIIKNKKLSTAKVYKKSYLKKLGSSLRPNLKLGEGIFFHPDLIHGDSKNLGKKTRVSLEIRFYRKEILDAKPKLRNILRNN